MLFALQTVCGQTKIDSLKAVLQSASKEQRLEIFINIGYEYYNQSKYAEALEYYKIAAIDANEEDANLLAKLFNRTARVYQKLASYELALDYYLKALKYNEIANNTSGSGSVYNNIGVVYRILGKYDDALKYYKKALEIKKIYNEKEIVAKILNNIGIVYRYKNEYDKSMTYYNQAIEIYREINDLNILATVLSNIAEVYDLKNESDKALKNCIKAYNIVDSIGNNYDIALISLTLGEIYLNQKDFGNALFYVRRSLNLSKKTNSKKYLAEAYLTLFKLYKETNKLTDAIKYIELYTNLQDSIYNEDMRKKTTKMQIVYETEKKEKENQKLINDKKINNIWLFSISIAFIVTVLLGVFIFIQKTKLGKAYKVLVHRNIETIESENKLKNAKSELKAIIENKTKTKSISEETDKYSASTLSDDKKINLLAKITLALEEKKMFLQHDLTSQKLADYLETNKNYVSQIINETFNKNFSSFINEYRIKEARILLSQPENKHLTIEAIAYQVGFKSKSSFNRAFKEFIGVNPSYFINNV